MVVFDWCGLPLIAGWQTLHISVGCAFVLELDLLHEGTYRRITFGTIGLGLFDIYANLDISLKIASIGAILFSGYWAYYRFNLNGNDDWNVNLKLHTEVLPYGENSRLLIVHLEANNPISTVLDLEKGKDTFNITLLKIPDGKKIGYVLDEDSDGDVIAKADLLKTDLQLMPNATFVYTEGFVVPLGQEIYVNAALERQNERSKSLSLDDVDYVTANEIVNVVDPKN